MDRTQEFITKVKVIHGDYYNLDKVEYKSKLSLVTIICPLHGEFIQKPKSHLLGSGCIHCGRITAAETRLKGRVTEEFIKEAEDVHGKLYDKSKCIHFDTHSKVEIICPLHGSFLQWPSCHLKRHGC
jgi:hypothetical protein